MSLSFELVAHSVSDGHLATVCEAMGLSVVVETVSVAQYKVTAHYRDAHALAISADRLREVLAASRVCQTCGRDANNPDDYTRRGFGKCADCPSDK